LLERALKRLRSRLGAAAEPTLVDFIVDLMLAAATAWVLAWPFGLA
jgi:hypothetical protein